MHLPATLLYTIYIHTIKMALHHERASSKLQRLIGIWYKAESEMRRGFPRGADVITFLAGGGCRGAMRCSRLKTNGGIRGPPVSDDPHLATPRHNPFLSAADTQDLARTLTITMGIIISASIHLTPSAAAQLFRRHPQP